jgi:hypothetical protein
VVVAEPQECHGLLKKKNWNRLSCVRRCIVVMQNPRARFPFIWPLATNGHFQSLQNLSNVDPQFDFRGHILSEHSLPCKKIK